MHSMISDQNSTYHSDEQIHLECMNEIYARCYSWNYFRLWAYLLVNWYALNLWKLWARSPSLNDISVLKTTMIVESHWQRVKHDCLHRYNRSRMDLVVSVLTYLVIPETLDLINVISSKNYEKPWLLGEMFSRNIGIILSTPWWRARIHWSITRIQSSGNALVMAFYWVDFCSMSMLEVALKKFQIALNFSVRLDDKGKAHSGYFSICLFELGGAICFLKHTSRLSMIFQIKDMIVIQTFLRTRLLIWKK